MSSLIPLTPSPLDDGSADHRVWQAGSLRYRRKGLLGLFGWLLLADFAWSLKERAVVPVAQILLRQLQASDLFIALVVGSIPAGLGMVLGPAIGMRSDRHRGRWGRRIPFLLLPTPLIGLSLLGLAFAEPLGRGLQQLLGAADPGRAGAVLLVFALCWAVFELCSVCANAVFTGLVNDVVPTALIGRFYGWFRTVSLAAGIFFTFRLMGLAQSHQREIFAGVGLVYVLGMLLMCLRVREGRYPAPPARPGGERWWAQTRRYLRECFQVPFYRWVYLAMTLGLVAGTPVNSFAVFYAQQMGWGLDGYGKLLALSYGISLVLAVPLGWLVDRFHPVRVGFACLLLYALCASAASLGLGGAWGFALAFVAHGVLTGAYLTATAALAPRLFPALRFAQFQSAQNLVAGLAYMAVPPLIGLLLDLSDHQYALCFVSGAVLAWAGVLAFAVLWRRFVALGGVTGFRAPD